MDFSAYAYTLITGEDFAGKTVRLDGHHFTDCNFVGAKLVFYGEAPFSYSHCDVGGDGDVNIRVEGRARMVLAMLSRMIGPDDLTTLGHLALSDTAPTVRPN